MTDDGSTTPLEVRAPRGAQQMEVLFADDHLGEYPHEILRGFCPCAVCQGHQGPIRFIAGGNTDLADIAEVGDYALRLTWADGHSTGIYTFKFLRELCRCEECRKSDPSALQFKRG
jgi:DUF971 family protein